MNKDPAINNETTDSNLIRLELEKRKIQNFIDTIGYEQKFYNNNLSLSADNSRNIEININGGKVSNLNLGKIIGNVNNNIEELNKSGSYDITKSIKEITEAITQASTLNDDLKLEYLEYLKLLSEEAIKPKENRNYPVIRTVLKTIGAALSNISSIEQIWSTYGPSILNFFDLIK